MPPRQVTTSYGLEWPGGGTATLDAFSPVAYQTRRFIDVDQVVEAILGEVGMAWFPYVARRWGRELPPGWIGVIGASRALC